MPPRTPGRSRSDRSAETGQRRSASARAASRSSGSPVAPGIGPRTADLLPQRREQRLDVDLLGRRKAVVRRLVRHREVYPPGLRSPGSPAPPACARTTLVVIHHKRCQRCLDRNPLSVHRGHDRSPDYDRRMRVALPLLTLVPGISGGSETYARELCRALARVGAHEYEAFVPTLAPDAGGGLDDGGRDRIPRLDDDRRTPPRDGGAPRCGPERSARLLERRRRRPLPAHRPGAARRPARPC